MTDDPYAAPRSEVEQWPAGLEGGGTLDLGTCLKDAWEWTKSDLLILLGAGLVAALIVGVSALAVVGHLIVGPVFVWGGVQLMLNVADRRARFEDIFSGFRRFGTALGNTFLLGLFMVVASVVCQAPMFVGMVLESEALVALGALVTLVASLAVVAPLYLAFFYMVDQDMFAPDAIVAAWNAARGRRFDLVLLVLLMMVVNLAGFLALCVGALVSVPMSYLMWASAYRQIAGRPTA